MLHRVSLHCLSTLSFCAPEMILDRELLAKTTHRFPCFSQTVKLSTSSDSLERTLKKHSQEEAYLCPSAIIFDHALLADNGLNSASSFEHLPNCKLHVDLVINHIRALSTRACEQSPYLSFRGCLNFVPPPSDQRQTPFSLTMHLQHVSRPANSARKECFNTHRFQPASLLKISVLH